jgi:hypothetical protein
MLGFLVKATKVFPMCGLGEKSVCRGLAMTAGLGQSTLVAEIL